MPSALTSTDIKTVCVYCGSSSRVDGAFKQAATTLGKTLAAERVGLVYGGGRVGLMGLVADATFQAGGAVIGIIPTFLDEKEIANPNCTELIRTATMHERKEIMARRSDAFVVLPGGLGTLDEFFEILTWRQLGLHDKPVVVVNVAGYWDAMLDLIDRIIASGFARPENRRLFDVVDTVEAVLPALRAAEPAHSDLKAKWL